MMISHSNAEAIRASLQSTEMKRRMMRIVVPKLVVFDSQFLYLFGQRVEQVPKTPGGYRVHFRGGHSRRSP